jgi:hypothetical protein
VRAAQPNPAPPKVLVGPASGAGVPLEHDGLASDQGSFRAAPFCLALVNRGRDAAWAKFLREHRLVAQKKTAHGAPWTKEDVRELKAHSKARTPLPEIAKKMKRTERALRRKAGILGIGLGHNR